LRNDIFSGWPAVPQSVNMLPLSITTAILSFATTVFCADKGNLTTPLTSKLILPSTFQPPQNFQNANLVHVINLEKGYPKESINVIIENIASTAQDEYFIPFTSAQMATIGGLEVKDRKDAEAGLLEVDAVEFDMERYVCVVTLQNGC
jgi:oligosaccharyltransferase complex subunit alpha (ribophorin I)